ncbi:hypothetical protein [Nannocystis radixulma]|uniref:Lipoprotein n=1 Tax=Nannocystis radixulma TaxID=2995305 RepID=A0ABT5B9P0_9BACT|nr:hypothetical protein [Nannocystis radixulma]MDC0670845.1 hypothetical protein [Nannocystis radixulma]
MTLSLAMLACGSGTGGGQDSADSSATAGTGTGTGDATASSGASEPTTGTSTDAITGTSTDAITGTSTDTSTGGPPTGAEFGVNDVSIMFPLPAHDGDRPHRLWLVPGPGESGPYFPLDKTDELPPFNADLPDLYSAAMVTSMRFDPCFGEDCQPQLRLVAQPVFTSPMSVDMLDDAAVHLFYALAPAEAEAVVDALAMIRDGSPVSTAGPLAVHPGLAVDAAGETGGRVKALVVEHCREDNLVRITNNFFAFDNWGFMRFDRGPGGVLEQRPIAGMVEQGVNQAWLRQAQHDDLDDPSGTISPAPIDGFTYLLAVGHFVDGAPVDPALAQAAAERVLELENPSLTSSDDVDCVSCHLAPQARLYAERNGVTFTGDAQFVPPEGVDTSLVLAPELQGNLGATIAFGWHRQSTGDNVLVPSINQRVINESALVAASL